MIVLGLETSCDETAAALVNGERRILAQCLLSQIEDHRRFGGVVPEIAARAHLSHLDSLVKECFVQAGIGFDAVDGIAATCGPGLIGGVMVGALTAKAFALALEKPFLAVNHLEAHALTPRLTNDVAFPYLLLLISGGHCQLLAVEGVGKYKLYGTTRDDAVGEAFDKVAKLLDLGFPGGPAVEKAAAQGDARRFDFPQPMLKHKGANFSFSGLKTSVRNLVHNLIPLPSGGARGGSGQQSDLQNKEQALLQYPPPTPPGGRGELSAQDKSDIAAAFQRVVCATLADRAHYAIQQFRRDYPDGETLVAAGGVASNKALRHTLESCAAQNGLACVVPPPALCTDNAAMVAWAGVEKLRLGLTDPLDFAPRPRWPLSEGLETRG